MFCKLRYPPVMFLNPSPAPTPHMYPKAAKVVLTLLLFVPLFLSRLPPASASSVHKKDIKDGSFNDSLIIGQLQLQSRQFAFTEGPVADKAGNVFFTDQPNNRIWKFDVNGLLSKFMEPAGRANGMDFDHQGNLLVCADEHNEVWSIDKHKKVKVLLKDYDGKLLNGPNDLWVDRSGGIYFTDPYYQRNYWSRTKPEQQKACVYYLPKGAQKAVRVSDLLIKPNGLVGSRDGKYLYVADIEGNKIYRFETGKDGALNHPVVFIEKGADGITTDEAGHLYLSGKGVSIYDKEGKLLHHIPVNEPWVANLCFGGSKDNILFITASTAIYTIETNQRGLRK